MPPKRTLSDVVWKWRADSGKWVPYDEETSARIEEKYVEYLKQKGKTAVQAKVDDERYVEFPDFAQKRYDNPHRKRTVQRSGGLPLDENDDDEEDEDVKEKNAKKRKVDGDEEEEEEEDETDSKSKDSNDAASADQSTNRRRTAGPEPTFVL